MATNERLPEPGLLALSSVPPGGVNVCCPSCRKLLVQVFPDRSEVHERASWLSDGDTILGLGQRLGKAGILPPDIGFDHALLIGNCPACGSDYFVVDVLLTGAFVEMDSSYAHTFFRQCGDRGQETNFIVMHGLATELKPGWCASLFKTPQGALLHHRIGPFPLSERDSVCGALGVMACNAVRGGDSPWAFASDLVCLIWDSLLDLTDRVHRGEAGTELKNASDTGYGFPAGYVINFPLGANTFLNRQSEALSHKSSMVPFEGLSNTNANR